MTQRTDNQSTETRPSTPLWVKALALGGAVIVLVVLAVMLMAGGEHGPGRHGGWVNPVHPNVAALIA